jgi:hypothetical protein
LLGPKCQLITLKAPETITLKLPVRQEPKNTRFGGLLKRGYGSRQFSFGWTWNAVMNSLGQSVKEAMESAADDFFYALARAELSEWTIRRIEGQTVRRWWRTSSLVWTRIEPGRPFKM